MTWHTDTQLDSLITCPPHHAEPIQSILLTGATGFIGLHLLFEWLRKTEASVYCLVRDPEKANLQQRLQKLGWKGDFSRVITLTGDLAQKQFGLSTSDYQPLAKSCDAIVHNAALVNFMRPYETLKPTNVDGTRHIIDFATQQKCKPIHAISSIAVFFSPQHADKKTLYENTLIPYDPDMRGGYKQSKWVAEQLLLQAQQRGVPINLYRLGRVTGDSQTGIGDNQNDLLSRVLKACIELQCFPTAKTNLNLVPVDYVAQAVVELAQNHQFGHTLHLCNPQSTEWKGLFNQIQQLGYPLQEVSLENWRERIAAKDGKFYSALQYTLRFPSYLFVHKPYFDTTQTQKLLQPLTCPDIDTAVLGRYFDYFQQTGFLHVPSPTLAAAF